MTKDYGQTWTRIDIDGKIINGVITQNPTNDTTQGDYSDTNGTLAYRAAMGIMPSRYRSIRTIPMLCIWAARLMRITRRA